MNAQIADKQLEKPCPLVPLIPWCFLASLRGLRPKVGGRGNLEIATLKLATTESSEAEPRVAPACRQAGLRQRFGLKIQKAKRWCIGERRHRCI